MFGDGDLLARFNREGPPALPSGFLMTTAKVSTNNCGSSLLSVQLMPLSAPAPAPARMKIRSAGETESMGRNAKRNPQRPLGATITEQNSRN